MTPKLKCYHVFVIAPSGAITHTKQEKAPTLEQLQEAVQGYIESLPQFTSFEHAGVKYSRGRAYANEEGALKGLAYNNKATQAWTKQDTNYASSLVGNVVFYAKGE